MAVATDCGDRVDPPDRSGQSWLPSMAIRSWTAVWNQGGKCRFVHCALFVRREEVQDDSANLSHMEAG
jgi:hypothetical protein